MEPRALRPPRLPGLLAALALLLAAQGPRASAARGPALWPLPLSVQAAPRVLHLSPDAFHIVNDPASTAGASCTVLQEAFRR